jgi:hypothetical protein
MKKYLNGVLVDLTVEEQTQKQTDIENWNNTEFDRAIADLRVKRDRLLAETDYLALSDNTLSAEMTTYRQALRDITNGVTTVEQVNSITWPTKP